MVQMRVLLLAPAMGLVLAVAACSGGSDRARSRRRPRPGSPRPHRSRRLGRRAATAPGSSWRSPRRPGGLRALEAVSASDVWAVGGRYADGYERALVGHWDGERWSVVQAADPGKGSAPLESIAAVSRDDLWAGGHHWDGGTSGARPLIQHWDGES